MRPVHGVAGTSESARSQSYSHSPYTRFLCSEDASPPFPIERFRGDSKINLSQCNSPHSSTYASTGGCLSANPKVSTPGPSDAELVSSPMARVGSVPIQVTPSLSVNARHRRSIQSPHVVGSNCSENGNGALLSSFMTPPLSGNAIGLQSSQGQEDGSGFIGSLSNGDRTLGLSHSWRPTRPSGPLVGSAPAYGPDESSRAVDAAMVSNHQYGPPLPQSSPYGYPLPSPPLQSHSYAPSGFVAPNLISSSNRGVGSPTLSSHHGWIPGNSVRSESEFSGVPNIGSFTHTMVAPTSRPSSYYNRGLSIQANTPQQALGHGVTCACRESSEVSPHMSSEGVTTPMAVTRKSKFTDETDTCSSQSGSTAGSIREDLPLCPKDELCPRINNRKHQYKYAHTCRLFPCYHGHVVRHARLFRHVEGQIAQPAGFDASRMSVHTLASVNFSQISMEAPNAYRIYISHGDKSHEIFGDWASVKVHTFKRYLHQVYHIPPSSQKLLSVKSGKVLDDEIVSVKSYDIGEDAVLQLVDTSRASDHQMCRIPFDEL